MYRCRVIGNKGLDLRRSVLSAFVMCKKKRELITAICQDSDCVWSLKSEIFCNCTWVACKYGPFTLEQVGNMMGVTRERIRQIELKALKRLQHKKRKEQLRLYWE
jgi:hypothetical protein